MKSNLKSIRAKYKVNQEETAEIVGISFNAYALKESGKREFTQSEIGKIKTAFKLTPSETCEIFFG